MVPKVPSAVRSLVPSFITHCDLSSSVSSFAIAVTVTVPFILLDVVTGVTLEIDISGFVLSTASVA